MLLSKYHQTLDYAFKCPVDYMAQKFADHGGSVYNYYFTQVFFSQQDGAFQTSCLIIATPQRSRTSPWGRMWNMSVVCIR